MLKKIRIMIAGFVLLATSAVQAQVVELALLLDASGSVGTTNWNLQTAAYGNIFGSGTFYDDFVVGGDTLWVKAYKFSGGSYGTNPVTAFTGWVEITDNASAAAFGSLFAGVSYTQGWTYTDLALAEATNSILTNGITSDRQIIDVSTDGIPGGSPGGDRMAETVAALLAASNAGVTTNFIGVGSNISVANLQTLAAAGGGFYTTAPDFNSFQTSLETKLFREIQGVPAPATIVVFALALVGLGVSRKRAQ
ncbi:MAG: DUF1194 domain-containing protein [Pseudomonadota bacterium]